GRRFILAALLPSTLAPPPLPLPHPHHAHALHVEGIAFALPAQVAALGVGEAGGVPGFLAVDLAGRMVAGDRQIEGVPLAAGCLDRLGALARAANAADAPDVIARPHVELVALRRPGIAFLPGAEEEAAVVVARSHGEAPLGDDVEVGVLLIAAQPAV